MRNHGRGMCYLILAGDMLLGRQEYYSNLTV
ncbi:hypothetical protein BN3661_00452 [Eubacteriaceae bacterium CHKCI005]|uniref:Uncharacterized protein n=1 Tax=Solibaculum mannosilyticum TaxID=2780922 RepID=A0A7I8D221_9FIRM|nr:hypothetical protein C12CBH8_15070 [Solibaculum mannosilyticum]CZT55376.1 hypothetical protein BN3661_00452 [Eubacteriaceae bacterium CHKCI005]